MASQLHQPQHHQQQQPQQQTCGEESSDSDGETEPARCFLRRLSTKKEIERLTSIKEGYLHKQNSSFQRLVKRYFKLHAGSLYYSTDNKSTIFNQIALIDTTIAECSLKNINHSFQVITPSRNLIICADSRREMEEWMGAIRSAVARDISPPALNMALQRHNWCVLPTIRPTFCNVCGESLQSVSRSGVTLHGLACEVCKYRTHKRCAIKSHPTCKWSTLASMEHSIIEDAEGNLLMPHQWQMGNFPANSKCLVCKKSCGSMLRLQDLSCLWCQATVHSGCQHKTPTCNLGPAHVSILPPTSITMMDEGGFWRAQKPSDSSPLLVFLNSKSGDSQGVKMLRRFKQLLNPAQVFDLMNGGPRTGLRLFQNFQTFRVLVCGGDGSMGWVLNEIDKLGLHGQCQLGILPLGTGNDLSRVLGWGASFDDDTQLSLMLERLERAQIQMFDRWSVLCYETDARHSRSIPIEPIVAFEDTAADHLSRILHSQSHNVVISSAMVLCSIVQEIVSKVASTIEVLEGGTTSDDSLAYKCMMLNDKMDALLKTLAKESSFEQGLIESKNCSKQQHHSDKKLDHSQPDVELSTSPSLDVPATRTTSSVESPPTSTTTTTTSCSRGTTNNTANSSSSKQTAYRSKEQLMCRANSLKKAIRNIVEVTERTVDEQNHQTICFNMENYKRSLMNKSPSSSPSPIPLTKSNVENLTFTSPTIRSSSGNIPYATSVATINDDSAQAAITNSNTISCSSCNDTGSHAAAINATTTATTSRLVAKMSRSIIDSVSSSLNFNKKNLTIATTSQASTSTIPTSAINATKAPSADVSKKDSKLFPSSTLSLSKVSTSTTTSTSAITPACKSTTSTTSCLINPTKKTKPSVFLFPSPARGNKNEKIDTSTSNQRGSEDSATPNSADDNDKSVDGRNCSDAKDFEDNGEVDDRKTSIPCISISDCEDFDLDEEVSETLHFSYPGSPTTVISIQDTLTPHTYPYHHQHQHQQHLLQSRENGSCSVTSSPLFHRYDNGRVGVESLMDRWSPVFLTSPNPPFLHQKHHLSPSMTNSTNVNDAAANQHQHRTISSLSTASQQNEVIYGDAGTTCTCGGGSHTGSKDLSFPLLNVPLLHSQPKQQLSKNRRSSPIHSSLISKVLLANADALCAPISPFTDLANISIDDFYEKCVMNNYLGVGLDAKIALDFHNKREEQPHKCRSRTRNMMWYGVLGGKEILQRTHKNLDQRVRLECDGKLIPLPNLQGIVVLNIPSYMGGTNFWGGSKGDEFFLPPSIDDKILEVVAVFGSIQLGISRVINLQRHRIAQCHSVRITIIGDEKMPVQVDGEAWLQNPGVIWIQHKNRAQVLIRHRAFEETHKTWTERNKSDFAAHKQNKSSSNNLQPQNPVTSWNGEDILKWLAGMDMCQYGRLFIQHEITGRELVNLKRKDLKDLGVVKVGHLKRILSSLKNLKKQSNNNTTASNSANNPNSGTSANVAAAVTATSTLTTTLSVSPIFNASDINTSVINSCSIGSIKSKPGGTFKETSMAASTTTEHQHSGTFARQHWEMSTPNHENIVQVGNIAKTIRSNNNDDDDDEDDDEDGEDDDEDDGFHEVVKL